MERKVLLNKHLYRWFIVVFRIYWALKNQNANTFAHGSLIGVLDRRSRICLVSEPMPPKHPSHETE